MVSPPTPRRATVRLHSSASAVAVATPVATDGLIFPRGEPGAWDESAIGSPVVRCFVGDNEQRWFLWYTGRGPAAPALDGVACGSGSIGVAVSSDGLTWARSQDRVVGARGEAADADVGAGIEPNEDWWCFDTCHLSIGEVQVLSSGSVSGGVGVYWLFYSGGDFEALPVPAGPPGLPPPGTPLEGLRMRPGLAMSQDARNWARIEGDHHTGALFDVGAPGEWDELFIGCPQVLPAGPRDMRMYYHSWDARKGRYILGLATSADGFKWDKQGIIFDPAAENGGAAGGAHDALGISAHQVVRDVDNKQFVMFYEAVAADNTRSVGLAVSKDGRTGWKRSPRPILVSASTSSAEGGAAAASDDRGSAAGAWDGGAVGAPCAVSMSAKRWRLYYGGRRDAQQGAWDGFGLALSVDGGELFEGVPITFVRRTDKAL